jgi:arsenite oxidase small subunit
MMADDFERKAHEPPLACPFHQWREDFPIRWDNDYYVTRRELTKFLTLGSALLAGANIAMAAAGHLAKPGNLEPRRIAGAEEVPPGGSLLFRYPTEEDPCILVRAEDGTFNAYSQVCTHLSCAVVYRPEEKVLFCPCHHGYFSVAEARPLAGPPTRPLPRILLEEREGELYALGIDLGTEAHGG